MSVFEQGYKDFVKGQVVNPYNRESPRYKDWEFGFNRAYFTNLERVRDGETRRGSQAIQSKEAV